MKIKPETWKAIGTQVLKIGMWFFAHKDEVIAVVHAVDEAKKKK
jgi:hypothetical protein